MRERGYDEIRIEELEVFAHHGVLEQEKLDGQRFYVNAVLYTDLHEAALKDDLTFSTHYGEVCETIEKCLQEHTYDLIETAAENVAQEILFRYPLIKSVEVEIKKPDAPIPVLFKSVSVKLRRGWHRAYIAFGSNMGDSEKLILEARKKLASDQRIRMGKMSRLIVTKPYGGVEQDDFLNGVCELHTLYTPEELLRKLHEIEAQAGRERKVHWGPRTLDLDILLYDDLTSDDPDLVIPHADMHNRSFVLGPMVEIAPFVVHPVLKKNMAQLLLELENRVRMEDNK